MSKETKLNIEDATTKLQHFLAVLIKGHCSFHAKHDPVKKYFNITSVHSADGMAVLIPTAEVKSGINGRYTELIINYDRN